MKKIISAVEKLYKDVEAEIEKREEYYDNRSDKWYESDACGEYEEATENLKDLFDALAAFIDSSH